MFALRLNEILKWIDDDSAKIEDPATLRDGFRAHIVRLTRDFLAFPHCENFALMPDHEHADPGAATTSSTSAAASRKGGAAASTTRKPTSVDDADDLLLIL